MGLLDQLFAGGPGQQGLLAGSAALLNAGGPSRMPISFGQGVAQALTAGQGAYADAQTQMLKKQMQDLQLKEYERKMQEAQEADEKRRQMIELAKNSIIQGDPSVGEVGAPHWSGLGNTFQPEGPKGFDQKKFVSGLYGIDPLEAMKLSQKDKPKFGHAPAGSTVFNEATGEFVGTTPDKAAKGTSDMQEFEYAQQRGEVPAGMSFTTWMRENKRAGATNITNKVDARTGESLAREVGPMVKASRDVGMSGVKLVDSASRILDAADKGNLYAGPFANVQLKAAQFGDKLGIAGKDTAEKIKNTREVIRGMAEQAVAARSTLGSQAQISNSEQELLTKATSGDIGDLTHREVVQIAELNDRLGRQLYGQHQQQLDNLEKDPGLSTLAKFYSLPPLPEPRKPRPAVTPATPTATNPQTGEKLILKDGKWMPMK